MRIVCPSQPSETPRPRRIPPLQLLLDSKRFKVAGFKIRLAWVEPTAGSILPLANPPRDAHPPVTFCSSSSTDPCSRSDAISPELPALALLRVILAYFGDSATFHTPAASSIARHRLCHRLHCTGRASLPVASVDRRSLALLAGPRDALRGHDPCGWHWHGARGPVPSTFCLLRRHLDERALCLARHWLLWRATVELIIRRLLLCLHCSISAFLPFRRLLVLCSFPSCIAHLLFSQTSSIVTLSSLFTSSRPSRPLYVISRGLVSIDWPSFAFPTHCASKASRA